MRLSETEIRFMDIIWDNEPINSGEIVKICNKVFGWKKPTTYTFIRRLQEKNALKNEKAMVRSLVNRHEIQKAESEILVDNAFKGSLPMFVASFLSERSISEEEEKDLLKIISDHRKK